MDMKKNLTAAFDALYSHRAEMEHFIDFSTFRIININKNTFLENKKDFLAFVKLCLHSAQRPREENITKGLQHFEKNYAEIKKMIDEKNIDALKNFVYDAAGVGQKIGSMMLEFI
jgi:hypothetical protein